MPGLYETIATAFRKLNLISAILGAAILFGIASIVFLEVALRYMFGTSRLWVVEVSEYALLFITFLGAPYLLEKNQHVMLDIVYDNLSRAPRLLATVVLSLIGLTTCSILTYVGVTVVFDQYATGIREATVMAPQSWWITAILPFGMFLISFQFLDKGIRAVSEIGA